MACAATGDAIVVEACDYPNGEPVVNISGAPLKASPIKQLRNTIRKEMNPKGKLSLSAGPL